MARDAAELVRLRLTFGGLTVLVVDDDAAFRDALRCLLEELGATVLVAADGNEALAILRDHEPALVLSDITMPGLDGYALARQMRRDPARRDLPVIAMSAAIPGMQYQATIRENGLDGALGKPFDYRDLDRAIRRLMVKRPQLFKRQRARLRNHATTERARARDLREQYRILYRRDARETGRTAA
jgi:CheY-like chemotaxis protein